MARRKDLGHFVSATSDGRRVFLEADARGLERAPWFGWESVSRSLSWREFHPASYFWRRYRSLADALKAYRVDRFEPEEASAEERAEILALRRSRGDALLAALEDGGFPTVRVRLAELLEELAKMVPAPIVSMPIFDDEDPEDLIFTPPSAAGQVGWELDYMITPAIAVFSDPRAFFTDPGTLARWDVDFDAFLSVRADRRTALLTRDSIANILWRWGAGALLNETIEQSFAALDPDDVVKVLSLAENREAYSDGRRRGAKDQQERRRRVDTAETKRRVWQRADEIEIEERSPRGAVKAAAEEEANRAGIKARSVQQRMWRATRGKK